jgi:hypothetical protein
MERDGRRGPARVLQSAGHPSGPTPMAGVAARTQRRRCPAEELPWLPRRTVFARLFGQTGVRSSASNRPNQEARRPGGKGGRPGEAHSAGTAVWANSGVATFTPDWAGRSRQASPAGGVACSGGQACSWALFWPRRGQACSWALFWPRRGQACSWALFWPRCGQACSWALFWPRQRVRSRATAVLTKKGRCSAQGAGRGTHAFRRGGMWCTRPRNGGRGAPIPAETGPVCGPASPV